MRIATSGGGTAGHVWPVLATIQALTERDNVLEVLYLGTGEPERHLVRRAGVPYREIRAGKIRRYGGRWYLDPSLLLRNLTDLGKVAVGTVQSLIILSRYRPDAVLAKGGFAAFPIGVAAWILRIPLVIHESDRVMGLANRVLHRLATRVAVSYDGGLEPKVVETGNPVRPDLLTGKDYDFFGRSSDLPTVLVMGGSQGAAAINRAVLGILSDLLESARVIHITGPRHSAEAEIRASELPETLRSRYFHAPFLEEEYPAALRQATLAVSRAGAGAIAEATAAGVPLILIPIPHSPGDHQRLNAEHLEAEGAGVVMLQDELTGEALLGLVSDLLADPERLEAMRAAARGLGRPDAAARLAMVVESAARGLP